MGTICTLLYADLDMFSGTYMQIVKLLGLDVPSLCLADLVKTYCSRYLPGGSCGGGMGWILRSESFYLGLFLFDQSLSKKM